MKKKIIGMFVCLIMILGILPTVEGSYIPFQKPKSIIKPFSFDNPPGCIILFPYNQSTFYVSGTFFYVKFWDNVGFKTWEILNEYNGGTDRESGDASDSPPGEVRLKTGLSLFVGLNRITFTITDSANQNGTYMIMVIREKSTENHPPFIPLTPGGNTEGNVHVNYTYFCYAFDPDGDEVKLKWDWGDGTTSDWIDGGGWIPMMANHSWDEKGNYEIKVKSKDIYDLESDWSDPLAITMPYSYNKSMPPFLQLLFERFPYAFPLLRQLMG